MIKHGLLKDTLNLVSVNIKERKSIIHRMNEERYERFIGISKKRESNKDKDIHAQHNSAWLANEKSNLGKYRLIYPIESNYMQGY